MGIFNLFSKKDKVQPEPQTNNTFAQLMTGQLLANYKVTHNEDYKNAYIQRLRKIGFSDVEAMGMFVFENMIIKHSSVELLSNPEYIKLFYFDLKSVKFPENNDYYINHQMFTVSEIVKIWDEAEWHYHYNHEREMPSEVWNEIFSITRYGGGELFMSYINAVSDGASIPVELVHKYANCEQGLLYKYKWYPNGNEPHPYGE